MALGGLVGDFIMGLLRENALLDRSRENVTEPIRETEKARKERARMFLALPR